jgi:hypothetical protein
MFALFKKNFDIYTYIFFHVDNRKGWPSIQIQLINELVAAANRMGHPALATRHLTFLLQTMYNYLTPTERKDAALQLQAVSQQSEGSPVPLVRFLKYIVKIRKSINY